ncbi:MAG: hypothetical protein NZM04_05960 [Methylacidiphilales bacterium]|nr:hypothetical protein [Candidatus Methylacidiphilales bacterium]MDW8349646.1 hypothetical protein [Verrucomicrobiae bacterium]
MNPQNWNLMRKNPMNNSQQRPVAARYQKHIGLMTNLSYFHTSSTHKGSSSLFQQNFDSLSTLNHHSLNLVQKFLCSTFIDINHNPNALFQNTLTHLLLHHLPLIRENQKLKSSSF